MYTVPCGRVSSTGGPMNKFASLAKKAIRDAATRTGLRGPSPVTSQE